MNYTDGKHWLLELSYTNAKNYYIVLADHNPLEDDDFTQNILPDLESEFVSDYDYLDNGKPDINDFEDEDDYAAAYDEWWNEYVSNISEDAVLITEDNIDNYGEEWLNGQSTIEYD